MTSFVPFNGTFLFLLLMTLFSLTTGHFLTVKNLTDVLRQVSMIGISTVGMTMIIISGGIDLSVGSVVSLTGIVLAKLLVIGISVPLAILITLCVGVLLGWINGFLINKLSIPPLIATLGTIAVYRGITFIMTGGLSIYGFPEKFRYIGQGYIGFMPVPVVIMLLMFVLGYYILYKTALGQYIYGVGSSEKVSYLSGVDVKKVKYFVYTFSGFLGALAGIVMLSRLERSILGLLIIGVLSNGMILLGIPEFYQMLAKGLVLIAAVDMDTYMRRTL